MKKTLNISIGGMSFQVEEDAFLALENYLSGVRRHFSGMGETEEIVSDIESRLAEQFAEKTGREKIITKDLVEELISSIGRPEEFDADGRSGKSEPAGAAPKRKKLYRDPKNGIIAGVASGLAAYFGDIDPVIIRVLFVASIFVGGFGILLYLILWLVTPAAKSDTDRIEMRGEMITLKNIEKMVKERVDEFNKSDHSKIRGFISGIFSAAGRAFRFILGLLSKILKLGGGILGIFLLVLSAIALAFMVFAGVSLIFNANSPYIGLPLEGIAGSAPWNFAVMSGFLALFIPLVFVTLLGTSLVARKLKFDGRVSLSLLALWIVSIAAFGSLAMKLAPQIEAAVEASPDFQIVTREVEARDFTAIRMGGIDRAVVYPSSTYKVVMEGRQRDLDRTEVVVEDGVFAGYHRGEDTPCLFCGRDRINYVIYSPLLDRIEASGASRVVANEVKSENVSLNMSGASQVTVGADAAEVIAQISGASRLTFNGTTTAMKVDVSGASRVFATDAKVNNLDSELSGASQAYFGDLESVKAELHGASRLMYKSAKSIEEDLSGSSRIYEGNEWTAPRPPEPPRFDEF